VPSALESAVDEIADKLGLDPLEVRKKNEASPVRMAQYDLAPRRSAGSAATRRPATPPGPASAASAWRTATGTCFASEDSNAQIRVHRDGSVELIAGYQDIGTGTRTAMAVVAAEELGIEASDITMRIGDTNFPRAPGPGAA